MTTRATPPKASAKPSASVATRVVRSLTDPSRRSMPLLPRRHPVPRTADGLDHARAGRPVELLPQVPHVHLDHVRGVGGGEIPDVVEERDLRQDLAGMAHEVLESANSLLVSPTSVSPRQH